MIYIADSRTIRKVTDAGVVTTLAGDLTQPGSADGTGSAARFNNCRGICVAPNGDIFVTDRGADTTPGATIRKVTQAGVVTTIAGNPTQVGSADGTGSDARFLVPYGIAIAPGGDLFVCDSGNQTIRRVTQAGVVTTFAGSAGNKGAQNGTGTNALFSTPFGIAVDASGNLFVSEATSGGFPSVLNFTVRKITPSAVVTTFAGSFGESGTADGTGPAARFTNPKGLTIDSGGNLFLADDTRIRKITPSAVVTTIGGVQGELANPLALAISPAGKIYIVDNYALREQQT